MGSHQAVVLVNSAAGGLHTLFNHNDFICHKQKHTHTNLLYTRGRVPRRKLQLSFEEWF